MIPLLPPANPKRLLGRNRRNKQPSTIQSVRVMARLQPGGGECALELGHCEESEFMEFGGASCSTVGLNCVIEAKP